MLKAFLYKGKETRSFKDGLWKINDLTNQLNQKNQDSQDLSQAVKEAQDTRDHADTVVNNSK